MKDVILYTDGACSGNPGPGGWGAILMFGDQQKEFSGGETPTTNNRMELLAVIEGLKKLNQPCKVTVYSDSAYLVNTFQQKWIDGWQRNGWKTANKKKDVENQDLWRALLTLMETHQVSYVKVKGHSDNKWNNRCDELAREAITKL